MQTPNDRGRLGRNAGGMTAFLGVLFLAVFCFLDLLGMANPNFFEMVMPPTKKVMKPIHKNVSQTI